MSRIDKWRDGRQTDGTDDRSSRSEAPVDEDSDHSESATEESIVSDPSYLETVWAVARATQGGLVATIVMTAFRLPLMRSLPPTANFWAKFVGGGHPEDYAGIGLLLHLLYGSVGGTMFGMAYARLGLFPGEMSERRGVVWGGLYGLALSVFGEHVVLRRVLDMDVESDTETVFHTSHLIYGLALGAWTGSRLPQQQRYDEYEDTR